jgi:putative MATE family efflux protein
MAEALSIPSKETPRRRDWTQGPILNNLILLSWPMIVMEAVYMISQIFDMVWVGRSGSAAIAALGICGLVVMMLSTIDMALISGARAMISRFMGAGDVEIARKVAGQAYLLACFWGILVTVAGSLIAPKVIGSFGVENAVIQEGIKYLRIVFAGWLSMELLVMGLYIVQSSGDSFNPMITEIAIRAVHLALCPLLVLGLWIFPSMGIAGAALSNVISQALGAVIGLWLLFSGRTRIKLTLRDFRFVPAMTLRLVKIGFPSLISMLQSNFSMFVLTWIIVPFGTVAVAANSLVSNINGFVITPNLGMGGAVSVLVGQNLGARKPERAVKSTWLGAAILEAFLVACSVIILVWAERLVGFFDNDPALVAIGAAFLRIATVSYLVMGLNSALMSCISGAGDTLPNMIVNIGMIWVLQIPLAYLLSHYTSLNVYGIRWGMVIATFAATIAYFTYFKLGKWKRKKV